MTDNILSSLWRGLSSGLSKTSPASETATPVEEHGSAEQLDGNGDLTPKVQVANVAAEVPSFALLADNMDGNAQKEGSSSSIEQTVQHSSTEKQKLSLTDVLKSSSTSAPPSGGLMPPPKQPSSRSSLAVQSKGLRVPSSGPLPNRGPPGNSQQRAGSSGRGKVLLSPGHSPMDWASLTRSENLSGVSSLQRVTPAQMRKMNGRKGNPVWSSWQGKVYNITPYLPFHPGGEKELMKAAGRDGTKLFMDIHPWVNWEGMLSSCIVGILVSEEEASSSLDSLD